MSAPIFTALDLGGAPVSGATVTFAVSPSGIIATPASVTSDSSGHASPTLTALAAGSTTLSAYVGAVLIGTVVVVVPDAAAWTGALLGQVNTFASGRLGFNRIDGFDAHGSLSIRRVNVTPLTLAGRGSLVPPGCTVTSAVLSLETGAGLPLSATSATVTSAALDTGAAFDVALPSVTALAVPHRYALRLNVTNGTTAMVVPFEAGTICGRTTAVQGSVTPADAVTLLPATLTLSLA